MTCEIKRAIIVPRVLLLERVNARELSAKLITVFICDFYSGVQRGQSLSIFFSPIVVFVLP